MTAEVAAQLGCPPEDVLVCSTGVIGRFLPREKLAAGIPNVAGRLASSAEGFRTAATAIMTTDTFPKLATACRQVGGAEVRVSGVAKGAAMIAPNMATMLAVLMTDAPLDPRQADPMLRHAVERSFNSISVDGHMSTSDTVLLLASGDRQSAPLGERDLAVLQEMVDDVAAELAQAIIRDAEGADHFVTLDVRGTKTREDAVRIARAIADSPLVKTAIAGGDPNWGRIISAAGNAGVPFREEDLSLKVNGVPLCTRGALTDFDAKSLSQSLRANRDVLIELDLDARSRSGPLLVQRPDGRIRASERRLHHISVRRCTNAGAQASVANGFWRTLRKACPLRNNSSGPHRVPRAVSARDCERKDCRMSTSKKGRGGTSRAKAAQKDAPRAAPAGPADLDSAIEAETQEIGRERFARLERRSPSIFERRWWDERILGAAMADESLKVQMFRFVDVLAHAEDASRTSPATCRNTLTRSKLVLAAGSPAGSLRY